MEYVIIDYLEKLEGNGMEDLLNQFPQKIPLEHSSEYAFSRDDALLFLDLLYRKRKYIILGGDVLDENLNYTYDNWFYSPQDSQNHIEESYKMAQEYVATFKNFSANLCYFVFTIDKAEVYLPLKL